MVHFKELWGNVPTQDETKRQTIIAVGDVYASFLGASSLTRQPDINRSIPLANLGWEKTLCRIDCQVRQPTMEFQVHSLGVAGYRSHTLRSSSSGNTFVAAGEI